MREGEERGEGRMERERDGKREAGRDAESYR